MGLVGNLNNVILNSLIDMIICFNELQNALFNSFFRFWLCEKCDYFEKKFDYKNDLMNK
jgi:hypothetical protein